MPFWGGALFWALEFILIKEAVNYLHVLLPNGQWNPGDQTHLFKVRAKGSLTFQCISEGVMVSWLPLWAGPAAAPPAGCYTYAEETWRDSWPHQMSHSRVQLMPHRMQTNSKYHINCFHVDVIAYTFNAAQWPLHIYNLVFQMQWAMVRSAATGNRQITDCRYIARNFRYTVSLVVCDTEQVATLIIHFCQYELRQHQHGL